MHVFDSVESFHAAVGTELGVSDWFEIDQRRVDLFAEATEDRQWIHVDVERAAGGPFGGTIAHGYLVLSLLVPLMSQTLTVENRKLALNYGLNKVRFPASVPVGSRVRVTTVLVAAEDVPGGVQATYSATITAEGVAKPVLVAEQLTRYHF
ncbi:MaoC family dehydratase [Microbacterium sp. X-17]|uniref:MaoC family dehydratase n=1 Tax=Microbacterium sp. X-17 TaxID=3144404 RepID=UPI0031F501DD